MADEGARRPDTAPTPVESPAGPLPQWPANGDDAGSWPVYRADRLPDGVVDAPRTPASASWRTPLLITVGCLAVALGGGGVILARRQPAASDLRLVISISKSVIDLERIGDEASKIARRAIQLCEEGSAPRGYVEVRHIGDQVRRMVRDSLDAFARFDAQLALSVAQYDKTVDREYKTALRELATYMMEDPRSISRVLNIIWALRSLERIGDHARNIAELVIYLVRGTDVRHLGLKRMQEEVQGRSE